MELITILNRCYRFRGFVSDDPVLLLQLNRIDAEGEQLAAEKSHI